MFYGQCHLLLPFIVLSCISYFIAVTEHSGQTGYQKRLLSQSSGLYVHIGENGALDGGESYSSAAVFTVTFRDTYYEFESDSNTIFYLMIQAINVTIETAKIIRSPLVRRISLQQSKKWVCSLDECLQKGVIGNGPSRPLMTTHAFMY